MSLIVQKFGGSSVKDAERIFNVADIVTGAYKAGNDVVVVVSAQGDTTDDMIEKANEINPNASKREMDQLLTAGEQMSASLLAMAIEKLGYPVVSLWAGRQDSSQPPTTEMQEFAELNPRESARNSTRRTSSLSRDSRALTVLTI